MEMTQSQRLPVPQAQAWEALNDVDLLKRCIPGCESMEPDGENAYQVVLTAAIGPVKARFRGRMALQDIQAPDSYTIAFDGQGGAAGFGKGTADVRLEPDGEETVLSYAVHAQVGGKIAQIGSRLVDGAARKMANSFFSAFRQALSGPTGENAQPDAAPAPAEGEPAEPSASGQDQANEPDKRKGLWTAWISKS
ncbi:CoxG family protein [Cupriavidus sp. AU9028]|uniref:CoxG family protein n=1 Tax=Cupriavidus sp. AU9028 TaxID=2871157 RepID=UPI001C972615|nr:carbon monoxide dehydrogenase subunit G [Cupriavidus sp. AU9028]MBY4896491.1 carbon monoxide dehydrogenase subunit G [Cupriavidus sp. AU9028]